MEDHRKAAAAHLSAAKLHKAGAEAAWAHESAASNHRQAAKAKASRAYKAEDPTRTSKRFDAYKEAVSAYRDHTAMANFFAQEALVEALKRTGALDRSAGAGGEGFAEKILKELKDG